MRWPFPVSDSVTFPNGFPGSLSPPARYPCSLCSNGLSANDASEQPTTAQTAAMIINFDVPHGGTVGGDAGDV